VAATTAAAIRAAQPQKQVAQGAFTVSITSN